jgi:hypothetical protein
MALADFLDVPVQIPTSSDPSQPTIAPTDVAVFPEEIMSKLGFYKDKAILVEDFEGFSELLQLAAEETGLNPAQDLEKIASVFNRYRIENGKQPI